MQISTKSTVVVAVLAAATLATSLVHAHAANNASPRRHVVEIHKFKFIPADLEASPGDTIVWMNRDIVPRTVTGTDKGWDSGTIKKEGQWQIVVHGDTTGAYYCRFHPAMKARVRIDQ